MYNFVALISLKRLKSETTVGLHDWPFWIHIEIRKRQTICIIHNFVCIFRHLLIYHIGNAYCHCFFERVLSLVRSEIWRHAVGYFLQYYMLMIKQQLIPIQNTLGAARPIRRSCPSNIEPFNTGSFPITTREGTYIWFQIAVFTNCEMSCRFHMYEHGQWVGSICQLYYCRHWHLSRGHTERMLTPTDNCTTVF